MISCRLRPRRGVTEEWSLKNDYLLTFDFCLSTLIPVLTTSTYVVAWPQGDQLLGGGPWHKANLPATHWLSLPFYAPEGAWRLSWQFPGPTGSSQKGTPRGLRTLTELFALPSLDTATFLVNGPYSANAHLNCSRRYGYLWLPPSEGM